MSHAGRTWKPEAKEFADPATGAKVRRLTDHLAHSYHLYFTNPGWWDGGQRLLIGSDRNNQRNLFSIELANGEITQLTDFDRRENFLETCVNPRKAECYFWHQGELLALDLKSLKTRAIYRAPDGYLPTIANVTADGQCVCTGLRKAPAFPTDLMHGYVGFAEVHASKPHCQVVEAAVDGSGSRVLHEEEYWIGHVNTSPTQSHLLSFCHEGPWAKVDCRIWVCDRQAGKVWKVRPTEPGERIGHEYWLADGETMGFHGQTRQSGANHLFGFIRYDNTALEEAPFPKASTHFHSNTKNLIVGDGSRTDPYLYLWRYDGKAFSPPRRLCTHRGSFEVQQLHVHPRFSPDGKQVLFTTDMSGYGNVYLLEVPAFEDLPEDGVARI